MLVVSVGFMRAYGCGILYPRGADDRLAVLLRPIVPQALAAHYRSIGAEVAYEVDSYNRFKQPSLRSAKDIAAMTGE